MKEDAANYATTRSYDQVNFLGTFHTSYFRLSHTCRNNLPYLFLALLNRIRQFFILPRGLTTGLAGRNVFWSKGFQHGL